MPTHKIYVGDALEVLKTLPDESVDCIVTSPPYYGLKNYCDSDKQIGLEDSPRDYLSILQKVFTECLRILKNEGSLFVVIGDTYYFGGSGTIGKSSEKSINKNKPFKRKDKPDGSNWLVRKQKLLIPMRLASILQDIGFICRNEIIWNKNSVNPCATKDRLLNQFEYIFHFTKKPYYKYNRCINENDIWNIPKPKNNYGHLAVFPKEIPRRCIKLTTDKGDTVLDPFAGSGTTILVAKELDRNAIGIELSPEYCKIAEKRLAQENLKSWVGK